MLMSIVKMPRYEIYWSKVTRYEPVASTLILKRYKKLPEFLHVVVVNVEKDKPENKEDKYFQRWSKTLTAPLMNISFQQRQRRVEVFDSTNLKTA